MTIELKIPDAGESIDEVRIVEWLKQEGDEVEEDENLVELETDKASMALPAASAGVLEKVLMHAGELAAVGETGARLQDRKTSSEGDADQENDEQHVEVPATPSARRELRKHGLTPEDVEPEEDRIRREDVVRHVEQTKEADSAGAASRDKPTESTGDALTEVVPMTAIRRRIAERLVDAQQNAALLTTFNQVDMSAVLELRQKHRERFENPHGC